MKWCDTFFGLVSQDQRGNSKRFRLLKFAPLMFEPCQEHYGLIFPADLRGRILLVSEEKMQWEHELIQIQGFILFLTKCQQWSWSSQCLQGTQAASPSTTVLHSGYRSAGSGFQHIGLYCSLSRGQRPRSLVLLPYVLLPPCFQKGFFPGNVVALYRLWLTHSAKSSKWLSELGLTHLAEIRWHRAQRSPLCQLPHVREPRGSHLCAFPQTGGTGLCGRRLWPQSANREITQLNSLPNLTIFDVWWIYQAELFAMLTSDLIRRCSSCSHGTTWFLWIWSVRWHQPLHGILSGKSTWVTPGGAFTWGVNIWKSHSGTSITQLRPWTCFVLWKWLWDAISL